MKKTSIWQWINFYSNWSDGNIVWYFWDFWDGETSTEANPTHSYSKEWIYDVELKLDFDNNNILKDMVKIEITE